LPFCITNIDKLVITSEKRMKLLDFLSTIQCKIPQRSSIKLLIDQNESGYYVELNIKSVLLNFKIECIEDCISDVVSTLHRLSEVEISDWHQNRIFA